MSQPHAHDLSHLSDTEREAYEYALHHGLTIDHRAGDPQKFARAETERTSALVDNNARLAQDWSHPFNPNPEGRRRHERELLKKHMREREKPQFPKEAFEMSQDAAQWMQSEDRVTEARVEAAEKLKTSEDEEMVRPEQALREKDSLDRLLQDLEGSSEAKRSNAGGREPDMRMEDANTGPTEAYQTAGRSSGPGFKGVQRPETPVSRDKIGSPYFPTGASAVAEKCWEGPVENRSITKMASSQHEPAKPHLASCISTPASRSTFGEDFGLDAFISLRQGRVPTASRKAQLPATADPRPIVVNGTQLPANQTSSIKLNRTSLLTSSLVASVPPTPRTFIISTTLLTQRSLIRRIRTLYPTAHLLERDFPSSANEADLALSPSTGFILTTLQRLHQLPLPGSADVLPPVHARLLRTAPRFARLVVLVAQSAVGPELAPLGLTDARALTALQAFARSEPFVRLGTAVEVLFAPSEGEAEDVAPWVVRLMMRYRRDGPEPGISGEDGEGEDVGESPRETWLGRAGLNALAARTVLGELEGKGVGGEKDEASALRRFVTMRDAERAEHWGKVLGRSVLQRIARSLGG